MKRLSMRNIKEILRLKFGLGLSVRQISKSTQLSRPAVSDYLRRFEMSSLAWPLPTGITDTAIDAQLFPPKPELKDILRPLPDWAQVHQELRHKGVTLYLLWEEYKANQPDGFLYSWYCDHYREWAAKLDVVMRQQHLAGEKCFVDYAGPTIPITNKYTGEIHRAQIFVGVMGASNYTYAEATLTQTLLDWIHSHIRMLEYFGVAPKILVPDNLKSGVTKTCRYEPEVNQTYLDFAEHYNIAIIPARSRKPRDKAKAETGVLIVERWILACLRHHTFFSLKDLNDAISGLLIRLNQRPFKKFPGCRVTAFRSLDYPAMQVLPAERYIFSEWKKAKAGPDYHIEVDKHYYSVPYTLTRKILHVNFSKQVIEVFYNNQRVASHIRLHQADKRYSTQSEHMPMGHKEHLQWTPERMLRWAGTIGTYTQQLIQKLMDSRLHPAQAFRPALGITRLTKLYGNSRVEAACRRAYLTNAISFSSVSSILKHRLDEQILPQDIQPSQPIIVHNNVRGAEYYH